MRTRRARILTSYVPRLAISFALILSAVDLPAEAQQPGTAKSYRLGVLSPGARPGPSVLTADVVVTLRELGYVEGKNLVVERRYAEGKPDQLLRLARDLVQQRVDVLVAVSPPAVRAAREATTTIPIVMLLAYSDPVELGFVASLSHPGGNITGPLMAAEATLAAKRVALLTEAISRITRPAILATGEASSRRQSEVAEKAWEGLGIKPITVVVQDGDYDRAFATMVAERADALLVVESVILSTDNRRIVQRAAKHRLPAMYSWREHVDAGGLMAYGGSVAAFGRRAARYVDRIFKGSSPAELPIERATTFELAINLKTAKSLGLAIPPSLLLRADHLVE